MTDITILTNPMSWGHGLVLRDLTIEWVSHWLVGIWFIQPEREAEVDREERRDEKLEFSQM